MAAESRFRIIANSSHEGILIADLNLKIQFANRTAEMLFGCREGELEGTRLLDWLTGDGREFLALRLDLLRAGAVRALRSGQKAPLAQRRDGKTLPIELVLSRIEGRQSNTCVIIFRDATERLRAEQALRESENRLRDLIQSLPVAVRIVRDECVVFANLADAHMHGFDRPEDEIGTEATAQVAPEEIGRLREYVRKLERGEAAPRRYTVRRRRRDGSEFFAEATIAPIEFEGGPARLIVLEDLTDRQRLALFEKLLPVCCMCGRIREDESGAKGSGEWQRLDHYVARHSDAQISHTFCPRCLEEYKRSQGLS
jgi:PAS domain S-box-containing protein